MSDVIRPPRGTDTMAVETLMLLGLVLLFKGGDLSVNHRYYLIQQNKTWADAQVYCRAAFHELATVETPDDLVQLQNETQIHQFKASAWIGLWNDVNSWRWSLGNEPLGIPRLWASEQPNNVRAKQECTSMKSSGYWYDDYCDYQWPFICFDANAGGSDRYISYSTPMTWYQAQSYCREHHTDLASSRNSTENAALKLKVNGTMFFGLHRDSWKWSDQTKVSNVSWKSSQPDNGLGNEACAFVMNGLAEDDDCSVTRPFFCHMVVTHTRGVRVKVQTDQDLDDPTVREVILEQFSQKLKEQGMENTTMSWREPPEGASFQKLEDN